MLQMLLGKAIVFQDISQLAHATAKALQCAAWASFTLNAVSLVILKTLYCFTAGMVGPFLAFSLGLLDSQDAAMTKITKSLAVSSLSLVICAFLALFWL